MGQFKKKLLFVFFEIIEIILFFFISYTGVFGIFGNNTEAWIMFLVGIGVFILISIIKMIYKRKEENN